MIQMLTCLHVDDEDMPPQNSAPEPDLNDPISPKPRISARNWGFGPEEVESPCASAVELLGCPTLPGGVALLGNLWEPCNPDQKLDHNPEVAAAAAAWAGALKASTAWARSECAPVHPEGVAREPHHGLLELPGHYLPLRFLSSLAP